MPKNPEIISVHHSRQNIVKSLWVQFRQLDRVLQIAFVAYILIIISTPFIVLNYQIFKSKAQTQTPTTLCWGAQNVSGELSCGDAINIALQTYPGNVEYVKKELASYAVSINPVRIENNEVWIIGATLDSPYSFDEKTSNLVEIGVDPKGLGTSTMGKWVVFVRERFP